KSQAAIALRDGETEHSKLRHLRNDIERDIAIGAMPSLRLRCDLAVGKLAHLLADRSQRLVQAAVADCAILVGLHAFDETRALLDMRSRERLQRACQTPRCGLRSKPQIGRTHDLALAHGNAALNLREIFANPEPHEQLFDLAQRAASGGPLGIGRELPHSFAIAREPGQAIPATLPTP